MSMLCTLVDCPPGIFRLADRLGFKPARSDSIADAYDLRSGQPFSGDDPGVFALQGLLVEPVAYDDLMIIPF